MTVRAMDASKSIPDRHRRISHASAHISGNSPSPEFVELITSWLVCSPDSITLTTRTIMPTGCGATLHIGEMGIA
jgi:hypothetical protein